MRKYKYPPNPNPKRDVNRKEFAIWFAVWFLGCGALVILFDVKFDDFNATLRDDLKWAVVLIGSIAATIGLFKIWDRFWGNGSRFSDKEWGSICRSTGSYEEVE